MAAAIVITANAARAQPQEAGPKGPQSAGPAVAKGGGGPALPERPPRISGRPNFNGIWQAVNTAYWNLESHSAEALNEFGSIANERTLNVAGLLPPPRPPPPRPPPPPGAPPLAGTSRITSLESNASRR